MMADNPELRKQFEAKLAADPQFAADRGRACSGGSSNRSTKPGDAGRYPIVRVWEKNW